jgi:nucleoid-associated protein YgaU
MKGWCDPVKYLEDQIVQPQEPYPVMRTYLTMPGDSLWRIADKFYKNGLEWKRIYLENKDKISNPNLIRPFMTLRIP